MLSEKENTHLSKFLSLVLRHRPGMIGIVLDDNGWTDVDTLIINARQRNVSLDINILKYIVETNSKKRFAFNETFDRIRANQGHSVNVELGYSPKMPPEVLYHGTALENLKSILHTGLVKRKRHHVHLSTDTETAIKVGQRHGQPVILKVFAAQMEKDGHVFYLSDNDVWLTDNVPVKYLQQLE